MNSKTDTADQIEAALGEHEAATFAGFLSDERGYVQGDFPPGFDPEDELRSTDFQKAGFDVVVFFDSSNAVSSDPDEDQIHLRDWREEPKGDGWKLAWRAENDDGDCNIVWWRPSQGGEATHKIITIF